MGNLKKLSPSVLSIVVLYDTVEKICERIVTLHKPTHIVCFSVKMLNHLI